MDWGFLAIAGWGRLSYRPAHAASRRSAAGPPRDARRPDPTRRLQMASDPPPASAPTPAPRPIPRTDAPLGETERASSTTRPVRAPRRPVSPGPLSRRRLLPNAGTLAGALAPIQLLDRLSVVPQRMAFAADALPAAPSD